MGNNTGEHQVHWIELLSTLSVQLPQQNHKVRQQVGGCLMWGPGGGVGWVLTVRVGYEATLRGQYCPVSLLVTQPCTILNSTTRTLKKKRESEVPCQQIISIGEIQGIFSSEPLFCFEKFF